ncbi:hypothetical protein HanIR_Chr09g0418471 [Helianthus annuus]|nr:hypothetical protein HanIR_Chr09g0418471 [Helianthus annuus]
MMNQKRFNSGGGGGVGSMLWPMVARDTPQLSWVSGRSMLWPRVAQDTPQASTFLAKCKFLAFFFSLFYVWDNPEKI